MSSTKPQVDLYEILQYYQKKTESQAQVTCIGNFVNFRGVDTSERTHIKRQTDKRMDRHTYYADRNTSYRCHMRSNYTVTPQ